MELRLSEGHNSRISCLVNLPILFRQARLTVSNAENFSSTGANLSPKSLYTDRIVPSIYLIKGNLSSSFSCQPVCACLSKA